ncbi:MAG TPA: DNA repair protein RecN [Chryseosolibacter sp.]|nr:DNA repair protein RecN [Chryseosolibacter sp.]
MLTHLTIQNYALIRHLELKPSGHLNVITGETGAGKSIMLGAIGLLMGNRADTKVLWNEDEKCIIEGTYDIRHYKLKAFFKSQDLDYDDTTVIRREISPGGKSRAFINDTPVTLEVMRQLGGQLMDVHSQHETLQLGNQSFQLALIDAYAANNTIREKYALAWSAYNEKKKAREELVSQADTLREESEYINFQLDELQKAGLLENEQESLETELKVIEHAEEIKNRFNTLIEILSRSEINATQLLSDARGQMQHISGFSPAYQKLLERLESTRVELQDIADEIEHEESKVEFDSERTEFVKERLSTIYRLLKKHRAATIAELLSLQAELQKKASRTRNLDDELEKSKQALLAAENELGQQAARLTDSRRKTFDPLTKQIVKLLRELGIPNAELRIECAPSEPSSSGADRIEVLFSANKGIGVRPLAQVASGGEFSRLMFCIKYVMAEKTAMPTLILDEIDNGVSGEIAIRLGNMMVAMSQRHQLITISHLPQIAAKGDTHYFVYKDNSDKKTISSIRKLDDAERVEEIAKMIGGATPSKVAIENAQELLAR